MSPCCNRKRFWWQGFLPLRTHTHTPPFGCFHMEQRLNSSWVVPTYSGSTKSLGASTQRGNKYMFAVSFPHRDAAGARPTIVGICPDSQNCLEYQSRTSPTRTVQHLSNEIIRTSRQCVILPNSRVPREEYVLPSIHMAEFPMSRHGSCNPHFKRGRIR